MSTEAEIRARCDPNWLPTLHMPAIPVTPYWPPYQPSPNPSPSSIQVDDSLDDLPYYKLCQPRQRPEDPAIRKMDKKLRRQEDAEMAPPRSLKPFKRTSGGFGETLLSHASINRAGTVLESDPTPASLSSGNPPNEAQEHSSEEQQEPPQMNDIDTSSAQNTLKRKADSSPSANKKRKTDTENSNSNPPPTPHHGPEMIDLEESDEETDPEIIDLEESDEDTAPIKLGILARDIGQEVRKRAKAVGRTKPKHAAGKVLQNPCVVIQGDSRTACTQAQPTEPSQVADDAKEGLQGAEMVDTTPKTASKNHGAPAGKILRNPSVVIYRDSAPHMQNAPSLSNGQDLGNNTVLGQKCANKLPRTKKQRRLAKSRIQKQALSTRHGVAKPSTPARKRTRKPPVDLKRDSPRVMRSCTSIGGYPKRHIFLNDRNKCLPLVTVAKELEIERRRNIRNAIWADLGYFPS